LLHKSLSLFAERLANAKASTQEPGSHNAQLLFDWKSTSSRVIKLPFCIVVSLLCCFLLPSPRVIMLSTAPAPAVFSHLFLAPDAPMGKTWLLSTRIPLSEAALHHLALASKVPPIAKAMDAYGHFWTASQMNKVPGRYWQPKLGLTNSLEQTSQLLNLQPVPTPMVRLSSLRLDSIGGILLVTQQYALDGTITEPYITVVAVPAMATLGSLDATNPPGYFFLDFWDSAVLEPFGLPANPVLHCSFMAAAKGLSQKVKLLGITDLMKDSQSLFFPYGEKATSFVQSGSQLHY
jgi:hypothetical protein